MSRSDRPTRSGPGRQAIAFPLEKGLYALMNFIEAEFMQ